MIIQAVWSSDQAFVLLRVSNSNDLHILFMKSQTPVAQESENF